MDFKLELSETVYKKEKQYAKSDAQKNLLKNLMQEAAELKRRSECQLYFLSKTSEIQLFEVRSKN